MISIRSKACEPAYLPERACRSTKLLVQVPEICSQGPGQQAQKSERHRIGKPCSSRSRAEASTMWWLWQGFQASTRFFARGLGGFRLLWNSMIPYRTISVHFFVLMNSAASGWPCHVCMNTEGSPVFNQADRHQALPCPHRKPRNLSFRPKPLTRTPRFTTALVDTLTTSSSCCASSSSSSSTRPSLTNQGLGLKL